jgi:hypothetical protein
MFVSICGTCARASVCVCVCACALVEAEVVYVTPHTDIHGTESALGVRAKKTLSIFLTSVLQQILFMQKVCFAFKHSAVLFNIFASCKRLSGLWYFTYVC